jgi:hypothetical protein
MAIIKPEQLRSGFYKITGSLYGTSSFAITASHVDDAVITASAVNDTITFTKGDGSTFPVTLTSIATASYALSALSSSYALTASYASNVPLTASYALNALSSSYALTASYASNVPLTASYALNALSSSYALTASYVNNLGSSNYTQSFTNQSTWTVNHNLNTQYVIVQVYDTAFDEVIPQNIDLTSNNTVTITFPTLESGTAVVTVGGALQNSGGGGTINIPGNNTEILFNSSSALGASQYFKFIYPSRSFQHGFGNIAQGNDSHAEGTGTLASGEGSHAEGTSTIASGVNSHAEGDQTQAIGGYSHAEGWFTVSNGPWSHAEGLSSTSVGGNSHAEGVYTTSTGEYSHAEGQGTNTLGIASHAEGFSTLTIGDWSHAEGFATVTSASYQHVQGTYNISSSITGAFIHGNGTSNSNRSNLIFAVGNTVQITGSLTVTGSLIVTGSTQGNVAALTISSNTASVDLTRASFFTITLTSGATTHISASNIQPGTTSTILVTTDGTSNVTFPSNVKQPSGSFYTASAVSAKDILTFISYDSTNLYLASVKNLI